MPPETLTIRTVRPCTTSDGARFSAGLKMSLTREEANERFTENDYVLVAEDDGDDAGGVRTADVPSPKRKGPAPKRSRKAKAAPAAEPATETAPAGEPATAAA